MILVTVIVAFVVYVILTYLLKKDDSDNFPPGPPGYPIFGNHFILKPSLHVAFERIGKQYRDVFTVKRWGRTTVILNSYKAIKEALVDNASTFAVRPMFKNLNPEEYGGGIIMANGTQWQNHRRFALKTLRDFGFAKTLTADSIHAELQEFIDTVSKPSRKSIDTKIPFATMTSNVICRMVFGQRLSEDKKECDELLRKFLYTMETSATITSNILTIFPKLAYIPLFKFLYSRLNQNQRYMAIVFDFMGKQIQRHAQTIGEISEPRDFVDALILHKIALQKEGGSHSFDEGHMRKDVYDLFLAGTDTTSVTLSWAMLLMSIHPEIQKKTRAEIHEVLGSESLPTMQEKLKLNYTLAVIDEISRVSTIAPISVPHSCTQDVVICGKNIPKGCVIMTNLYAVHREPGLWKHPETFNPENFLDEKGNYKASEHLIQFSLGKRSCLGESLARMEVFIFFVGIMQNFRVSLRNQEAVDLEKLQLGVSTSGTRHLDHHEITFHEDT